VHRWGLGVSSLAKRHFAGRTARERERSLLEGCKPAVVVVVEARWMGGMGAVGE